MPSTDRLTLPLALPLPLTLTLTPTLTPTPTPNQVDDEHRKKLIECKTTHFAVKDLDNYYKVSR